MFVTCWEKPDSVRSLPSRRQKQMQKAKLEKVFMYDRDIVCLPHWYVKKREPIKIPRKWDDLSKHRLIGKI